MKLSEKISILRNRKDLTQEQLGELSGVKRRAIIYYENGQRIPDDNILHGIAYALDTTVEFLLNESQQLEYTKEELFIIEARAKYGSKGAADAKKTINQVKGLMTGGELDEEDKEAFFDCLQEIYFDAKERAKEKYGRKK